MRPTLEPLRHKTIDQSILSYSFSAKAFRFKWHYHPEFELTYIVKGSGKRLVGDSYEDFYEGDLVLLGSSLPHTWVGEKAKNKTYSAIVIQFPSDFLQPLSNYGELNSIKALLSKTGNGLVFDQAGKKAVIKLIRQMVRLKGFDLLLQLLKVLEKLSHCPYKTLSSKSFKPVRGIENEKRINVIFQYVQTNFAEKISVKRVAGLIHLSGSAFCKFFKRISGRTFSDYVNDVRIVNAYQLLMETDKSISSIAYKSGFTSITYFNRVFYRKKRITPREVRRFIKSS